MNDPLRMIAFVVVSVLLFAVMLSVPVWMRNKQTELQREQRELQSRSVQLRNEEAVLRKEANLLVGRERIETVARRQFGLEYRELPIAVLEGES